MIPLIKRNKGIFNSQAEPRKSILSPKKNANNQVKQTVTFEDNFENNFNENNNTPASRKTTINKSESNETIRISQIVGKKTISIKIFMSNKLA